MDYNNDSSDDENMLDTQDMPMDMEADQIIDIGDVSTDTDEPETMYVDATVEDVDDDSNKTSDWSLRDRLKSGDYSRPDDNADSPNETYDYDDWSSTKYERVQERLQDDNSSETYDTENTESSEEDDNEERRSITARIADAAQSDIAQKARAGSLKAAQATSDAVKTAGKAAGKVAMKTGKAYWDYTGSVADDTSTRPNQQQQMQPQRIPMTRRGTGMQVVDRDLYEPTAPRTRREPTPEMVMGANPGPNDGVNVDLDIGFSADPTQYQEGDTYDLTFGFTDDGPASETLRNIDQRTPRTETVSRPASETTAQQFQRENTAVRKVPARASNEQVTQSQQPMTDDFGFNFDGATIMSGGELSFFETRASVESQSINNGFVNQPQQSATDSFSFNFDGATMMGGGELNFFDTDERRRSSENDFEFFGGRLL